MMRRAVASASFLLRKKENIGAHPWDAKDTPMIDPARTSRSAEEGPGRRGNLNRGLASSRGSRGCWGNAAHDYKRGGIMFQPSKRAQKDDGSAPPFSPS